jgi:hypothetical protein
VVRVDPGLAAEHRAGWRGAPLHPAAVHSATSCLRVATIAGTRMELRYRYESWVRLTRGRPRPRVDLGPLAQRLTAEEEGAARWSFDGAGALTAALHPAGDEGATTISGERFVALLSDELADLDAGPPAWDPY